MLAGTAPQNYSVEVSKSGNDSLLRLGPKKDIPVTELKGFGTVMQMISAENYLKRKIRLSAKVKVTDVSECSWAGIWMRIDDQEGRSCAFDNMYNRRLVGSTDWVDCEVILEVPANSAQISFGILLHGAGEAAVRDITFSVISSSANETSARPEIKGDFYSPVRERPLEPVNLQFAS